MKLKIPKIKIIKIREIELEEQTIKRLKTLRKKGESFDKLINRILDHVWEDKKVK